MKITPDQAQTLLDGTTPGPWRLDDHDDPRTIDAITPHRLGGVGHPRTYIADVCRPGASPGRGDALAMTAADGTLIAAAPDLAQFIAGMTELWLFQVKDTCSGDWETRGSSTAAPEDQSGPSTAENLYAGRETRWVRQYVTAPEVVDGE